MNPRSLLVLAIAASAAAACAQPRDSEMELRSFQLERMTHQDALNVLRPYISEDGTIAGHDQTITVRETPERLDEIARVLAHLQGAATLVFRFQIIEADGFTGTDSAIAGVEQSLRELFRFSGYRLVNEIVVSAREGEEFFQSDGEFRLQGEVRRVRRDGAQQRVPLKIALGSPAGELMTTVNAIPGETIVIGSNRAGRGALILAVHTEIEEVPPANGR